MALRIARARLVMSVRRMSLSAACPLHHPFFGGRSPSRRCAGEVGHEVKSNPIGLPLLGEELARRRGRV
jgi:hypothetical protein